MVFSLLAYFFSMVAAFAIVMTTLVGFGESQMRAMRLPHYPAESIIAKSDRDALTNVDKAKEAEKAAEARKAAEAQKAADAREAAKKLARAKLARERKQAALARQRQERDARDNALAWSYQGQYPSQYTGNSRLYSYAPGGLDR
jgi:hypothetical protein